MARIRGLGWKRDELARDLHVLPGQTTRPLNTDLRVHVVNLTKPPGEDDLFDLPAYLAAHADTTFEFRPLFSSTLNGELWDGDGLGYTISVHRKTGVVTVATALPAAGAAAKRNFIVEAVLSGPDRIVREVIRIQIHHGVTRAWLTPGSLTVRLGSAMPLDAGPRFTVRAEFDDGLVGDVTVNHGVSWTADRPSRVTAQGFLRPAPVNDAIGDVIEITATAWPAAADRCSCRGRECRRMRALRRARRAPRSSRRSRTS